VPYFELPPEEPLRLYQFYLRYQDPLHRNTTWRPSRGKGKEQPGSILADGPSDFQADMGNLYKNLINVPMVVSPEMPNRVSNIPPKTAAQTAVSNKPSLAHVQGEGSTLFSDWLKRDAARQSDYATVDDVVRSRVIRTDRPQKTVVALEKAVRYDVQDMVRVFDGLSNGVREACYEYIRTTHVFPVSVLGLIANANRGFNWLSRR